MSKLLTRLNSMTFEINSANAFFSAANAFFCSAVNASASVISFLVNAMLDSFMLGNSSHHYDIKCGLYVSKQDIMS